MSDLLRGHNRVTIMMDDILVCGSSEEEQNWWPNAVYEAIRKSAETQQSKSAGKSQSLLFIGSTLTHYDANR